MSEQRTVSTLADANNDREAAHGEIAARNRRNVTLADIDTGSMATNLSNLFDRVMSGQTYDEKQIKNATNLTNTIVKVLRFEFDVYKHFVKDAPGRPAGRPADSAPRTIGGVAEWLRAQGDNVEKRPGAGNWLINTQPCEEKDLIIRANNIRKRLGQKPFDIELE